MHSRALLLSLALALPLPIAVAATAGADGRTDAVAPGAALARALDSVRAENLEADLYFIASDELGGRDTPSEGLRVAARFIRSRLQRLGFQPGAPGGYFYEYALESRQLDLAGTSLELTRGGATSRLTFGSDYFFWSRNPADTRVSGEVVFVGEGEELEGLDVSGRWALAWDNGGGSRRRMRALREAGALGVLTTPGPEYDGRPYAERYESAAERATRPSVSLRREREASEERAPPFPVVNLTRAAAAGLVADGTAVGALLEVTAVDVRKRAGEEGGLVMVENVCGFWPGNDPVLQKEVIILSAHYDHVGTNSRGEIYNGADDNGSGTCGLLGVAEALREYGPMRRSVLLMWVSGEEKGLWGSQAWTTNPWLPEGCQAICDINIDMIGRNEPDKLLITPTAEHEAFNGLARMALRLAPEEGFPTLGDADAYWRRSDHMNFNDRLKIPVAFLFSDVHEDYHKTSDTAEKIDYDKMRRVVRLVVRMLDGLQADELDL